VIRVEAERFDPGAELASFMAEHPAAGAIASFIGAVRGDGGEVTQLELSHYPGFTERALVAIGEEARLRFDLLGHLVVHRFGSLGPAEPIVFVAAAAPHRRAALDAVDYLMDRLKTEAPFWKREHGPAGARWIEARDADHAARARWEERE
jgi:molybdopterin synthase catalytic subunit